MNRAIRLFLTALVLGLSAFSKAGESFEHEYAGVRYIAYEADLAEIELHWKNGAGEQYRNFAVLQTALRAKGREPLLLMNAGIFDPGGIPSGLHVEAGKTLKKLNEKDAPGNFYLKPNGVFMVTKEGRALVVSSSEYAKAGITPALGLQSGPLLLRHGKIHPAFREKSKNQLRRNGVGVNREGKVILVMTADRDQRVNLHGFAEMFRLSLDCPDALFLDGDISLMEVAPMQDLKKVNSFGAILAVTRELDAKE